MLAHLLVHLVREVVVSVPGGTVRHVECERCSTRFRYRLERVGIGRASAFRLGDDSAARARARPVAEADLARRLAEDADVVPCPKCFWVNRDAVAAYRRGRYPLRAGTYLLWTLIAFFVPSMIGGALIAGAIVLSDGRRATAPASLLEDALSVAAGAMMLVGLAAPLTVFVGRWLLRRRIDPNRTRGAGPPPLPSGTPAAVIER